MALIGLAFSLLPLLWLALGDPKRLRSRRLRRRPAGRAKRRVLAGLSLIPGVALAIASQWPAILIWLGGLTVSGWLLVLWLARGEATA